MRRYGLLIVVAFALLLAVLRSLPSSSAAAAPLLVIFTDTPTSTATLTPTQTATPTTTGSPTTTATRTSTSTRTQTATTTRTPTQSATPTSTPTIGILLPIILKIPSPTPTATFTATPTKTPTKTPTAFTCNGRFDGSISLEENKPTYATYIEWVKFIQWVHNNNGQTTCFGILGFNAIKPDGSAYQFNTQWSASGVSSKLLTIYANCWGPYGQPCAGSQGSGQQEDHMGSGNYVVAEQGVYTVYYMVCYSNYNDCQNPDAHPNWAQLGVIQFTAVNWTPGPPQGPQGSPTPAPTVTENSGPVCYLITNDPRGTYLKCEANQLKERHLFRS